MRSGSDPARPAFAVAFPPTPHGIPARWIRSISLLVLGSLVAQHGFPIQRVVAEWLNWLDVLLAGCFAVDLLLALRRGREWRHAFQLRRFEFYLLGLFLFLIALALNSPPQAIARLLHFFHLPSTGALAFNLVKLYLLLSICVQTLRGIQRLFDRGVRAELILAGSFATLIMIGTFLLLLPNAAARPEASVSGLDAFFMATSAVCVTGLAVLDVGSDLSTFGQLIVLALIQVGGLGIITFVAFLSIFSTRALPVPQMVAFSQLVNAPALSDLKRQLAGILLATAVIEGLGVVLLYQFFTGEENPLARIKWSVFHSVSAFCNAGFALQPDSLTAWRGNAGLMVTFMALMVLGGLGFLVIPELLTYRFTRSRLFRRMRFFRRLHAGRAPAQLSVQARLSLRVTWLLLAAGFLGFWALEFNHLLQNRPWTESFLVSAFQSATARTTGFNTVPIDQLRDATLVFLMMLMVIGASPVSMGGGIKTVSFGILLLALRALVARRERVEAFGRTIPVKTLFAALSVFVLYVITASVGIFLLALFDPEMKLQDQAFEVISALSTVGLSTGITAELSTASKLALCLLMFIGRVGPISLVLSVFHPRRTLAYEFPEEEVVVG